MSTPLNFKSQRSGGVYGTHTSGNSSSSNGSNHAATRQRRTCGGSNSTAASSIDNTNNYGPFSSPHGSFDDPLSFPPYAELPFTALKRRKQLENGNSFVKWAMRGVLLSPVIVLVLWSIVALVFTSSQNKGHSMNASTNKQQQLRRQQQRISMSATPNMGITSSQTVQSPLVYMQPQQQAQQFQQLQDNNGMMMVVTPQRKQQGNLQDNNGMMMVVTPQRKQLEQPQELQDNNGMRMVVTPQRKQLQGELVPDQQYMATASIAQLNPEIYMAASGQQLQQQQLYGNNRIPLVGAFGSGNAVQQQPDQAFQQQQQQGYLEPLNMASENVYGINNMDGVPVTTTNGVVQQQLQQQQLQQHNLQGNFHGGQIVMNHHSRNPPRATLGDDTADVSVNGQPEGNSFMDAAAMQQQQQQQPFNMEDQAIVDIPAASLSSPVKQAVYYYDPKDTSMTQNGDILQLPKVVYDINGKAIPLSELKQAPIYFQPPAMGSVNGGIDTMTDNGINDISAAGSGVGVVASSIEMQAAAPAREAVQMPQWGKSTSQDQTIIVATVAVMALLVGALSARRLRSKSFLASCIENETLEDDMAYDSAYTTTAGASGADSSYNTFGGWKGDLEKFDV